MATQSTSADSAASDTARGVTRAEWLEARRALLAEEKEFTRARDRLSERRRQLPWVEIDTEYRFRSTEGEHSLGELFDGRTQLVVYHFMMGPDWEAGCPSCSFWADNYDGVGVHLNARDTTLVAVSRAPVEAIEAYRNRMGWSFPWYSSLESEFNMDFDVSFPDPGADGLTYNFSPVDTPGEESPGISVFIREGDRVFHTYSAYARGLDPFNSAYQLLDLTPLGRNEGDLPWSMAWLRRHDEYDE